jgi:hypothetical protein
VANHGDAILLNTLSYHLVFSLPQPIYWPVSLSKLPDILDYIMLFHIVSSSFSNVNSSIINLNYPTSDHSPILLVPNAVPRPFDPKPSFVTDPMDYDNRRKKLRLLGNVSQKQNKLNKTQYISAYKAILRYKIVLL